jgi:hypothetical protein
MSILLSCQLNLSCDQRVIDNGFVVQRCGKKGEFVGRNEHACLADAKLTGWTLHSRKNIAICPECVARARRKEKTL